MVLSTVVDLANITSAVTGGISCSHLGQAIPEVCQITQNLDKANDNIRSALKDLFDAADILAISDANVLRQTCRDIQGRWKEENEKPIAKKKKFLFFKSETYATQLKDTKKIKDESQALLVDIADKSSSAKMALLERERRDIERVEQKRLEILNSQMETKLRHYRLTAELNHDEATRYWATFQEERGGNNGRRII